MRSFKDTLNLFILPLVLVVFSLLWALPSTAQAKSLSLAPILKTKIFVQKDKDTDEKITFNVPESGKAILRIVNGAKIDAEPREHIQEAIITLNGQAIAVGRRPFIKRPFKRKTNVLEFRVSLRQGVNQLVVKLPAKRPKDPTKRLSLRIDAPADKIVMTPILNSVISRRESLRAQARITGLGMPVPDAEVLFEIRNLGPDIKKRATTGNAGMATAYLRGFKTGKGVLRASLTRSGMSEDTPIKAVEKRSIILEKIPQTLKLEAGTERIIPFTVNVLAVNGRQNTVKLGHAVEPDSDKLLIHEDFPGHGVRVNEPRNIQTNLTIKSKTPGRYSIKTTAMVNETKESYSIVLPIEVVKLGTPEPLLLGIPMATPSSVKPGTPTEVILRAQVDGASTPPDVLFLDELDLEGKPLKWTVAKLRDNGKNEDTETRDRIYSGTLKIDRPASELRFRVRATYFGEEVVSGATTLLVTPFPRQLRPSAPQKLVPAPGTPSRIFSNEVEIKVFPGVSPDEMVKIATSIRGKVVGVIPPLRIYLIEFPGDDTAKGVMEAIAAVSKFSQVESAAPNFEMVNSAINFNNGTSCDPTDIDCPNDGSHSDQWYLERIGARQAWEIAGGGSASAKVAVIDNGVDCNHPDLVGSCTATGSDEHATQVAGIIAAKANNGTGIAGVAWDTQLEPTSIDLMGLDNTFTLLNAVTDVDDVKILNISQKVLLNQNDSQIGYMRDGFCYAVDAGKLIVVAGGNIPNDTDEDLAYPAKLNELTSHCCPGPGNRKLVSQLLVVGGSDDSQSNDGKDIDRRATWISPGSGNEKFSNDAPYIDLYAPGVRIRTITPPSGVTTKNGTTLSAALVSGAAAVLWAYEDFSPPTGQTWAQAVHERLIKSGDAVDSNWDNGQPCQTNMADGLCRRLNLAAAVTPPQALDHAYTTDEDISVSGNVLTDDTGDGVDPDNDGDSLTAVLEIGPSDGTLTTFDSDGSFSYEPDENFNGTDSFTYMANDGYINSATATVTLTVTPVNDKPSFDLLGDQEVSGNPGPQTVPNFASADPGGGPDEAGQTFDYHVTSINASLFFSTDPAISPSGTLTYTPAPPVSGTVTVFVSVTDSGGTANGGEDTSDTKEFTITVTPVNNPPTADAGVDQTATALTTVSLDGSGSSDPDGDSLEYDWSFISRPTNSTATLAGATTSTPSFPADRVGTYQIKLTVSDGLLESVDTVTVTVPSALSAGCRNLLVGSSCHPGFNCVSLRFFTGSENGETNANDVAQVLRAEGITFIGPLVAPLLSDVGSLACVGWRPDIDGTPQGAQCLADLLGAPYQTQNTLPTQCNFDGFPYEVVADE